MGPALNAYAAARVLARVRATDRRPGAVAALRRVRRGPARARRKRMGDGLMAVFPAPQLAFDAVGAARTRLADVEVAGYQPRLRAGLHTGRPRALGGDYLGVDVNVAARLAERASADELLVSGPALAGLDPAQVASRRKRTFRLARVEGVPDDLDVWAVTPRQR